MACPIDEPTATPLYLREQARSGYEGKTYAAVLAICPNRPEPCDACGAPAAWPGGACGRAMGGIAAVLAVRACCCGMGREGAEAVGREGARPPAELRERGMSSSRGVVVKV